MTAPAGVEIEVTRAAGSEDLPLPRYMTDGASGMDVVAANVEDVVLAPGDVRAIPTGLFLAVPEGFEVQVRARSGLALKHGLTLVNGVGSIDADYRGEVKVILGNVGRVPVAITRGMRIAQLVLAPIARAALVEVAALGETRRGSGGFGSTGI
jgi:dUTP pyrophosphatase